MSLLGASEYAQHIQNLVNHLWNSANHIISGSNDTNGITQKFNFDPASDLVTLLMDMSPEDRCYLHSEGKSELNSILEEKRCNITISTNLRDMIDNNQVSISGSANNVFDAYQAVCRILPITVWFDLQLNTSLPSIILDPTAKPLKEIQKTFEISICVVPQQSPNFMEHISFYLRSTRGKIDNLQQGIVAIRNFIETNNYGNFFPTLQTKIDVPINRPEIIGRTCSVLDNIGQKTSTNITAQRSPQTGIANVSISGKNFPSVCFARTEISDRFIVELNFEITAYESKFLNGRQIERLGEETQVHILMKPSLHPNHKTMIVRGSEKEVHKLFEVRRSIIQLIQKPIIYD
jgi:hypothetical protein